MRTQGPSARPQALIDLYVPARLGTPEAVQAAAARAGLDAVVIVAEDAFELPNAESMAAVNSNGGPRVLVAPMIAGPGYRFVLFLPSAEIDLESIEAAGDPRVVQAAVSELGGLAVAACPRQGPDGEASRTTPVYEERQGVVALTLPGSRLGRDLDLEDAAIAERPILGASGPFAAASDIGRYATLLPIDVRNGDLVTISGRLLSALKKGLGFAVEVQTSLPRAEPDPNEGRQDDGDKQGKQRRRRRRKPSA